jgi:hypothetical protein
VAQWRGGIGTPAASSREGNETTALVAVANPAAVRTTEEQLEMVAGEIIDQQYETDPKYSSVQYFETIIDDESS